MNVVITDNRFITNGHDKLITFYFYDRNGAQVGHRSVPPGGRASVPHGAAVVKYTVISS